MSDPKRLLEELAGLSAEERRALGAGRELAPTGGVEASVWQGLCAHLGPLDPGPGGSDPPGGPDGHGGGLDPTLGGGVGAAGAAGSSAAGTAGTAAAGAARSAATAGAGTAATAAGLAKGVGTVSLIKHVAIGIGIGVAGMTAGEYVLDSPANQHEAIHAAEAPSSVAPTVPSATPVRRHAAAAREKVDPEDIAAQPRGAPARARATEPAAEFEPDELPPTADLLPGNDAPVAVGNNVFPPLQDQHEEARLVSHARSALNAGNVAQAMQSLQVARSRFQNGVLVQEREALWIEALARSGQRSAAAELGQAFLRAHPSSPHAARVRNVLGQ